MSRLRVLQPTALPIYPAQNEAKAAEEHWQKERERRRHVAAQKVAQEEERARERARIAEEERQARVAEEKAIKLDLAREKLLGLSLRKCPERSKADLWLKNYDPKLRGRPWDVFGERLAACEKRLQEIRFPLVVDS